MKKGTIIAVVVAIALIIAGGIVLVMGLSFAGTEKPESTLIQQEVLIQENFANIQIDTDDCDVTFVPYNGTADAHVLILEQEKVHHNVTVEDNTLKIEMIDERQWMDYIGVNWEHMEITVYLPEKQYDSLWVAAATGDIRVPKALSGKEIMLRSSTGKIYCEGKAEEVLDCMATTGDIYVQGGGAETIKLQVSTGKIYLSNVQSTEIHLQSSTGDQEITDVSCKTLTCSANTGDVELDGVTAEEYLQVFTTTGEVEIENSDADRINIETDTGDISLPAAWKDRNGRIETDSGDIKFE